MTDAEGARMIELIVLSIWPYIWFVAAIPVYMIIGVLVSSHGVPLEHIGKDRDGEVVIFWFWPVVLIYRLSAKMLKGKL